jgi:hypothetical protein
MAVTTIAFAEMLALKCRETVAGVPPSGRAEPRVGPVRLSTLTDERLPWSCKAADFGLYPPAAICFDGSVRFVIGKLMEWREP